MILINTGYVAGDLRYILEQRNDTCTLQQKCNFRNFVVERKKDIQNRLQRLRFRCAK